MSLWEMAYSQLNPVWKQYDAPYYDDYQYFSNFKEFELQKSESIWMELGIGIYDKKFWNTGIGKVAMLQWIDRTFQDYLELEHLGLTTWSGNLGMMKLAEKLRMKKEAHIPKVRYYQGKYFDSIKYGILREDWEKTNDGYYQINGNS